MSISTSAGSADPAATDHSGTILVAPHQFPDLALEQILADEYGLPLHVAPDKQSFRDAIPDAKLVLVTPYARVEDEDFQAMTKCVAVIRYGIGYDNIDIGAANRVGIPVSIVPGAATEEVASHAFAMGLSLARRIPTGQAAIASQGWAGTVGFDTPRFSELQIGVVGMGRIGRQVANWYSSIGCAVRAYDPFMKFEGVQSADLDDVLTNSDIVTLHLPLSDATRHMVSADVLSRMRPRSVIVNVSRGGLIDEAALAESLRSGHLAGAGLDTFEREPLAAESPLRGAPDTLLTPHVAWRSNRALATLQESVVFRARQALNGETLLDLVTE